MRSMIAPFVVNIWLEVMLAEGEGGVRKEGERFSFIFRGHSKDTSGMERSIAVKGSAPRYLSRQE